MAVTATSRAEIISYPVEADGRLGAGRDEITIDLGPSALAFSGGRAYVVNVGSGKIISYPVGAGGELGAGRDEITGLNNPYAIAFSGGGPMWRTKASIKSSPIRWGRAENWARGVMR